MSSLNPVSGAMGLAVTGLDTSEAWQAWLQSADAPVLEAPAMAELAHAAEVAPTSAAPSVAPARDTPGPALLTPPLDSPNAVQPLAPAVLSTLQMASGPELRWRPQDASPWRTLFDAVDADADDPPPELDDTQDGDIAQDLPPPPWAAALLERLRAAAAHPDFGAALRPALQAWRAGQPVLLASPAGLACLSTRRDAALWAWRRWPARWRTARPSAGEHWWAVRLGLDAGQRPCTRRELAGARPTAPGQVSCELRLDGTPAGLASWTEVLVHAPAQPSLRALLAARASLTWLLCNQALWP